MKFLSTLSKLSLVTLGLFLLGGCQSVQNDLEKEIYREGKPRREVSKATEAEVQIPDLDKRKEDTQYLSKIDRLKNKVFELTSKLKAAEEERIAAVKIRDDAQMSQSQLADLIEQLEGSLASASDREKKLKERLIRSELESVRYQQMLANLKIQQLTEGANK